MSPFRGIGMVVMVLQCQLQSQRHWNGTGATNDKLCTSTNRSHNLIEAYTVKVS
jgi:hypothetical protein